MLNPARSNPKKIGVLSADLYGYFNQGQVQKFSGVSRIYRMVKWLSQNTDYNLMCFVRDFGQPDIEVINNITFIKGPFDLRKKVYEVLKLLTRQPADLLVEFYPSSRVFLLWLLKKIFKKRYVYFVGSDIDVNGQYKRLTHPLLYPLYVFGIKHADSIVCQTQSQAQLLKTTYGLASEVVLSPYVEVEPPLDEKKDYLLWVGRSAHYKRPDLFMDLARTMPDHRFVMVCNSDQSDRDKIEQMTKQTQILPNLTFLEVVPHNRIKAVYARAKCLVNTSDFEGFPNTFIEAALEKTPVISLNVDPNTMLTAHQAGICCQGDFSKLITSCRNIATDSKYMASLGEYARSYAVTYHGIDHAMSKIVNIMNQVMDKVEH